MTIPPLPPRMGQPPIEPQPRKLQHNPRRGCEFIIGHNTICRRTADWTLHHHGHTSAYCDYHLGEFAGLLITGHIVCTGVYWLTADQWQTFDECAMLDKQVQDE